MGRHLREGSGALLVLIAAATLFYSVVSLRARDYIAAVLLIATGLAVLRSGVELLRPSVGE
ncbi:MAG: hypothetical protein IPK60_24870 [Sandaracinaceae bacterium]|jgi:hypothetical protein|nr:hypothetical protein [Sandaracinaceae bacterium]